MECVILRNCYVDRLYMKGEVHDVAASLVKTHPKNFREVGVSEEEEEEARNIAHEQKRGTEANANPTRYYFCTKTQCMKRHTRISKLGKAHKKYEQKEEEKE